MAKQRRFEGGRRGIERGAHIEPADVLSGLGEGSEVPESTAKLDGAEEEEGGAGLDAVAPGGEVASARWWRDEAATGRQSGDVASSDGVER